MPSTTACPKIGSGYTWRVELAAASFRVPDALPSGLQLGIRDILAPVSAADDPDRLPSAPAAKRNVKRAMRRRHEVPEGADWEAEFDSKKNGGWGCHRNWNLDKRTSFLFCLWWHQSNGYLYRAGRVEKTVLARHTEYVSVR